MLCLMLSHICFDPFRHLNRCRRIVKIGRSDGYCRGAGQNKLQRVLPAGDPAHPDQRNLHGLSRLVDHTDRNGPDGRTGHASGLICHGKCLTMDVDLHPCQRIDQGDHVCPAGLHGLCHLRDAGHIGAELHNDRLLRVLFHFSRNVLRRLRILSERNPALLHIGAGNVDLQQIHRLLCQPFHHLQIILCRLSAHIDNDLCVKFFQKRDIPSAENLNPWILQTDSVHHTTVGLRNAGSRIAGPGYICHALCDHGSQPVQIHKLTVFLPGAEGARSGHDRIFQFHPGQVDGSIQIKVSRVHQTSTSVLKNTGPSLQTRLLCTWLCSSISGVRQIQARQAPTPQAIRSSIDT